MKHILPQEILKLHKIFNDKNFDFFVVGGAVRDFVKNEIPKDFDIATNALPDTIIELLKDNNYECDLQGVAFGVVIVKTIDGIFEIATFREDISEGRKPIVKVGATIENDCARRDLVINSLYYDISNYKIIDTTGFGIEYVKNNIISFVGIAEDRIREDKLRVLRAIRFLARYNGTFSPDTLNALSGDISLDGVSKERIFELKEGEFFKAKKQTKENFFIYLNTITKFDLWKEIFNNEIFDINDTHSVSPSEDGISFVKQTEYDAVLILAIILKNTQSYVKIGKRDIKIEDFIISECKIASEYANKIGFLIRFIRDFNSDNVFDWYKDFVRTNLTKEQLSKWFDMNDISSKKFTNFINYEITTTAMDIMLEYDIPHEDGRPVNKADSTRKNRKQFYNFQKS